MKNDASIKNDRREFLRKTFSSCAFCCFAAPIAFASDRINPITTDQEHNFQTDSGMSYEQVFNFAYRDFLIPQLIATSKQIGREKFIEMLKTATDEVYSQPETMKRINATLTEQFWSNVLSQEVLENTPDLRVVKITKCLWAKTFREAEAADIGYAMLCHGDYASAKLNNEKLERETTLMQGHDCCLLKWTKIG